jgi:hypothetical protein
MAQIPRKQLSRLYWLLIRPGQTEVRAGPDLQHKKTVAELLARIAEKNH